MLTMENVAQSLAEVTAAIKKSQENALNKDQITLLVESTLKGLLKNHPGFTPARTLEFPDNQLTDKAKILREASPEIQYEMDKCLIMSKLLNKPVTELKAWGGFVKMAGDFKKAMDTATATEGAEWIPTELSANLIALVRLQLKVAALFPVIQMPTNPYVLPMQIGRARSYKHSEQTADTGQTKVTKTSGANLTGKVTLTAMAHAVEILTSDELTEDSIVPMIPFLRSEIITALAEGREDCIINGDTTGSHQDTDISDSDDNRKMWKGLRKLAIQQSYTTDLSTLSLNNTLSVRGSMGKYGVAPAGLAWVTGIAGFIGMMKTGEVQTLDKYGPGAVVLQGELGKWLGSPIIVSEFEREVLNASGVYESGQTKTAVQCVYRNGFAIGERSGSDVRVLRELYAESAQIALIARERVVFSPLHDITAQKTVWQGINVG